MEAVHRYSFLTAIGSGLYASNFIVVFIYHSIRGSSAENQGLGALSKHTSEQLPLCRPNRLILRPRIGIIEYLVV